MTMTRARPLAEVVSPARAALATAIVADAEELREFVALKAGSARADSAVHDAKARVAAAQEAIETAKEAAVQDLIDGRTPASGAMTRADADDAADGLVAAIAAREQIAARLETAERRQNGRLSADKVRDRAYDVMRIEGGDAIAKLVADLDRAQMEVLSLQFALRWLIDRGVVPVKDYEDRPHHWVTPPAAAVNARGAVPPFHWQAEGIAGAAAWVDALELLMKDADAPLP